MIDSIALRREFHKYPEAGWTEVRTSARILEILESLGVPEILCGREVLDLDLLAAGPGIDLSEPARHVNMERAVAEGAGASYVDRTEG